MSYTDSKKNIICKHKWYLKNRDKILKNALKYRLKVYYDLSLTEYNELKELQENKCAICQRINLKLCVDHNHKTKIVRGLLCRRCNLLLGYAGENLDILLNAIEYLKQREVKENGTRKQ